MLCREQRQADKIVRTEGLFLSRGFLLRKAVFYGIVNNMEPVINRGYAGTTDAVADQAKTQVFGAISDHDTLRVIDATQRFFTFFILSVTFKA